jgi:hypothetical protein
LQELTQKIIFFDRNIKIAGIDSKQNINEVLEGFEPPVANRVCLFASNGIFMDTLAGFQTRDVPLNTVTQFESLRISYFMLEHTHEALKINCELRLKQLQKLYNKYPEKDNNNIKLKIIESTILDIGNYCYKKHNLYESMIRDI